MAENEKVKSKKSMFCYFDEIIGHIENLGVGITFALLVVLVSIVIFYRYVLKTGLMWNAEVQEILVVALAMFGSAKATRENGHTELSLITNKLSRKGRVILRTITSIAALIFLIGFFIASIEYTLDAGHLKTIMLRIPYWRFYIFMPIGMGLTLYEFAKQLKSRILTDHFDEY